MCRTEAARTGFKHAWAARDYAIIVRVAEWLLPSMLQEDAGLLVHYDSVLMRVEEKPEQGGCGIWRKRAAAHG